MRTISEREKQIIQKLNHPLYTVEFLKQWINRNDNPMINAVAALQAMGAKGFYEAVKMVIAAEDAENIRISREMIAEGYRAGLVRLIDSPNGDGTVCQIGDNWIYFGGLEAEGISPEEYKKAVPEEDIINEIFSVLDDFKTSGEEFLDEYHYYAFWLKEHGICTQ